MNLDNLNLVELNAQEVQEVTGGQVWQFLALALAYDICSNWDESVAQFKKGANSRI
jgi:hypothetical protein